MPRGRMLSKSISHDELIATLSVPSALLYTWIIPHLDVEGRIYADPNYIKGTVCPYKDEMTLEIVTKCLDEITEVRGERNKRLVVRYGNDTKRRYLQVCGFFKHNRVDVTREAPSVLPAPPRELLRHCSGTTPDQLRSKSRSARTKRRKKSGGKSGKG